MFFTRIQKCIVRKGFFDSDYFPSKPENRNIIVIDPEIQKHIEVTSIKEMKGIPLGKLSEDNSLCVSTPVNTLANGNIMVYGSSGTGKVTSFVDPYIYKAIDREESFVTADTTGQVYEDTYYYALKNDYQVKVFNCSEPEKGNSINLLKLIGTDSNKTDLLVDILVRDSNISEEDSYNQAMLRDFLKACILHITFEYKCQYMLDDNSHLNRLKRIDERFANEEITEEERDKLVKDENQRWESAIDPIHGFGTIGRLHDLISECLYNFDEKERTFKPGKKKATDSQLKYIDNLFAKAFKAYENHPALQVWKTFQMYPESHREFPLAFAASILRIFYNHNFRRVFGIDDIDMANIGNEKTAIYVVLDPFDRNKKVISSIFFTLMIKGLRKMAKSNDNKKLKINTNIIMNDYYSIGEIPEIEEDTALCRTYGINMIFILQGRPQLMIKHPNNYKAIEANCAIVCEMDYSDSIHINILNVCSINMGKLSRNDMPQWNQIEGLPKANIYRFIEEYDKHKSFFGTY